MGAPALLAELGLAAGAVAAVLAFADPSQHAGGVVAALALAAVFHLLLAGKGADALANAPAELEAAAPEHQALLVGCSGAGKTTLFRQLGLAFGPGSNYTALERLNAAAGIRCSVLTSMLAMVRYVHEFLPQAQHDLPHEDLRALLLWVVEVRLSEPLAAPIAACVHSEDDDARVRAAADLARRMAEAFGVEQRDIHCPTLDETPSLEDGSGGDLQLSFALCVAGDDGAPIDEALWGRMAEVERALTVSLGAQEITVYEDPEDVVRYLCPLDRTDPCYAEKWAYWRRAVAATGRLWAQSDSISQAWARRDEHVYSFVLKMMNFVFKTRNVVLK